MTLLRRVLYLDALVTTVIAATLWLAPAPLVEDLLGLSPAPDYPFLALLGASLLPMALLMVLIGHRVDAMWWWCWAFVVFEAGWGVVLTLEGAFRGPHEASSGAWWLGAAVAWLFAFAFLWGIARAGTEAQP